MPPAAESLILFYVLCAVFVSLPVAMLIRFLAGNREPQPATSLPPPWPVTEYASPSAELENKYVAAYAPLSAELIPPPLPASIPPPPWTRKDAIFAILLALAVGLLMGPGVALLMNQGSAGGEEPKMKFSITLFVTQIIFQAGVIGVVLAYLGVHRKFRLVPLFGLRSMSAAKTLGVAVVWLVAAYFVMVIISPGLEPLLKELTGLDLKPQDLVERAPDISDPAQLVLMFVTLCVGAPLMEEIIFRGVLFNVASRCIHPGYANVATSLLFGVIHNNLLSFIPLTLLGMFFAEAYRRTHSLAVPILMHSIFNCISFVVITNGLTNI